MAFSGNELYYSDHGRLICDRLLAIYEKEGDQVPSLYVSSLFVSRFYMKIILKTTFDKQQLYYCLIYLF